MCLGSVLSHPSPEKGDGWGTGRCRAGEGLLRGSAAYAIFQETREWFSARINSCPFKATKSEYECECECECAKSKSKNNRKSKNKSKSRFLGSAEIRSARNDTQLSVTCSDDGLSAATNYLRRVRRREIAPMLAIPMDCVTPR